MLILASASPRRQELLRQIGCEFRVVVSRAEELSASGVPPEKLATENARMKAEEAIANDNRGMISLGGWGGYVVFGFDHMIENIAGQNDFIVLGNAFYSSTGAEQDGRPGGSCEPGIVLVSYDANGNGQPDDEWYELAGSEYTNPLTIHGYTLTYHRSSSGTFPAWIDADSLTFTGTRLPDNYEDLSGTGTYYVQYAYPWGYVDNHPNSSEQAQLNIDWAVTAQGEPANLPGIHFVKVYTGVNQQCGWLGETSTEIIGATDLHLLTALAATTPDSADDACHIYTVTGQYVGSSFSAHGSMPASHGIYILRSATSTRKLLR